MLNTIDFVKRITGHELTSIWAESFSQSNSECINDLIEQITPFYDEWLNLQIAQRVSNGNVVYHCFDPHQHNRGWDKWLTRFKQALLYYPNVTVSDPLANVIWPVITSSRLLGDYPLRDRNESKLRSHIFDSLTYLAEMAPLIKDKSFELVPSPFVPDYEIVQSNANKEFFVEPGTDTPSQVVYGRAGEGEDLQHQDEISAQGVRIWGHICALLDYTPVAGRKAVKGVLANGYENGALRVNDVASAHSIIHDVMRYQVPNLSGISLQDVISLRTNERAIAEWHSALRAFTNIFRDAITKEELPFGSKMSRTSEALLRPCLERLENMIRRSTTLSSMLATSPLTLGVTAISLTIEKSNAGNLKTLSEDNSLGWVAGKLLRQISAPEGEDSVVRDYYSYLLENGSAQNIG